MQKNRSLTFSDDAADPAISAFIIAAAANGATGMGAGLAYMGNRTIHVGFGTTPRDRRQLVWGAQGKSENAPAWLVAAAKTGWGQRADGEQILDARSMQSRSFTVLARHGVRLRGGPGTKFSVLRTLAAGSVVDVLGYDGSHPPWAQVSLEGEALADGYVLSSFLGENQPDA